MMFQALVTVELQLSYCLAKGLLAGTRAGLLINGQVSRPNNNLDSTVHNADALPGACLN